MVFSVKPFTILDSLPCKRWRMFLRLKHLVSIEKQSRSVFHTEFL